MDLPFSFIKGSKEKKKKKKMTNETLPTVYNSAGSRDPLCVTTWGEVWINHLKLLNTVNYYQNILRE